MVKGTFSQTSFEGYADTSNPDAFGVSSAVVLPSSAKIINLSGMVGDVDGVILPTLEAQVAQAFAWTEKALLHAAPEYGNAEDAWHSVFEVITYHVGGVAAAQEFTLANATRYFGRHRPTWTAVGVTDLLYPGQLFEMQVRAVAP